MNGWTCITWLLLLLFLLAYSRGVLRIYEYSSSIACPFIYYILFSLSRLLTVKGREAGHLRVKGPRARICWPFGWFVCLKLWTNILSCCMKSGKARNLVWFSLDEWFPMWPQIWKWTGNWPPTNLPDYYLHNHRNVNAIYFHILG